ncbi:hypothetical protein J8340_23360, partial [Escherichia coli]|uniref:hypothetical protein n=1 Tax=Escherichia coli TaxID=562 RepID=UPI001AEC82D0
IRKVAKEQLMMVRPILEALRSGRKSQLLDYNDIVMPDITEFINKEQNQIQLQTFIKESKQRTENRKQQLTNMKDEAKVRLQLMGFSEKQAMEYVSEAIKKNPVVTDLNQLVQEAYRLTIDTEWEKKTKRETQKETIIQNSDSDDLRSIIQVGKKSGESAYEALKQAGMIRNDFGSTG